MWCEINGLWINIMVRMSKTILHVDDNKRRREYCISNVNKNVQVSHSFAPRYLYYMHFLRILSALCTKALKCLNMSVLWRVGNVDFCMHFGDAIYTCLHSKYLRLHCLHYHVQLLALAACHFGIGGQKKMSD